MIRFYSVLLGFTGFHQVFTEFYWVSLFVSWAMQDLYSIFFPQVLPSFSKDIIDEYLDMTSGWISMDLIGF